MADPRNHQPKTGGASGEAPGAGTASKIIKRYTNRKLYDTVESRYVTLDEIAEMVRAGEDLRIIDNRTKEDLTTVTLAQIIFEQEKKTSLMPLSVLREIVRHGGGTLTDFFEKEIQPRVASIREEAGHRFGRVFRREGRLEGEAEFTPPPTTAKEARASLQDMVGGIRHSVEDWQRRLGTWQRELDDRFHQTVQGVAGLPALHKDLLALRTRLDEIERRISQSDEEQE